MKTSRLQQELGKKQPFDSPEQEAMLNVMRTNDQFHNLLGRFFREFDLTASQYNVLRILRGEGKPMPSLEIGKRMIQVVPAMTGLIDRLLKQGLVERRRGEEDRRVVYVGITNKARKRLKKMDQPLAEIHKQLMGHLTRVELNELSRLLVKARSINQA